MLDRLVVDSSLYRDAMSRYAGHVQIVTTAHEGEKRGVTITAACSVSDNPAMVLACVNASNPKNAIFEKSGRFALNTLSAEQIELANAFSGRNPLLTSEERFSMGNWQELVTGSPVCTSFWKSTKAFDLAPGTCQSAVKEGSTSSPTCECRALNRRPSI